MVVDIKNLLQKCGGNGRKREPEDCKENEERARCSLEPHHSPRASTGPGTEKRGLRELEVSPGSR